MHLGSLAASRGFRLESLGGVGSTNDEALARARAGDVGGLWIVAESQTGGRGRQGRAWVSPTGNLYASLLLIDPCESARAPELGFVAGVALKEAACAAIAAAAAGARSETHSGTLGLKWPNDLVASGAKVSGMLLEASRTERGALATVVGIGVNCRNAPGGLAYPTADLSGLSGAVVARETVFAALSDALAHWLAVWRGGENFAAVRAAWLAGCVGLGAPITVARPEGVVAGVFKTIDETGRLIISQPGRDVAVDAGDVLLTPRSIG